MIPPSRIAPPASTEYVEALVVDERLDLGQRCLRTTVDVPAGAVIASFADSQRVDEASYLTIQLDHDTHLVLTPNVLECVNHSCEPNVSFDLVRFALIALTPVRAGEELTYAYPSTEWTMTRPFACACGSAQCLGIIDGASTFSAHQLARYPLTPFVRAMLDARTA
jgi:hypothetical protein